MSRYDFIIEMYRTERIKTLSVWSQFNDEEMEFRPELRVRRYCADVHAQSPTPCVSLLLLLIADCFVGIGIPTEHCGVAVIRVTSDGPLVAFAVWRNCHSLVSMRAVVLCQGASASNVKDQH